MTVAQSLQRDSLRKHRLFPPAGFQVLVATVLGVFAAVAVLVFARRMMGAFSRSLSGDTMLLTALGALAIVAFLRRAWRRFFPLGEHPAWDLAVGYGSSLALALLAVGCCYPAYDTRDWLIWLPMLVADQFWRQTFLDDGTPGLGNTEVDDLPHDEELSEVAEDPKSLVVTDDNEQILQQLFRVHDQTDRETVYGTVRADFASGQRTAVVHIGFCPPLRSLPEIEVEAQPGYDAKIKVVQALAHGTRLDVRRPPHEVDQCHIWIDLAARETLENLLPAE